MMTAAELGSSHHGPFRAPSARAEAGRDRSHTVGSAVKEGLSEVVTPMLSQSCGVWGGMFPGWEQRVQRP